MTEPAKPQPRRVGFVRDDYSFSVGREALERQTLELKLRFPCCGELRESGHHAMCSKAPPPPDVIDGQESLL